MRVFSGFPRGRLLHAAMFSLTLAAVAALGAIGCGDGSQVSFRAGGGEGTVSVHLSDPPVCRFPAGDFKSVFISIRSVQANVSTAEDPSGWVELAPQLATNPVQIDLLSDTQTSCVLAQLSNKVSLRAGDYRQIRLVLVSNTPAAGSPVPSSNACGSAGFNCVVGADDIPRRLLLSSQDLTGLKIPPGQILGGPIRVENGQHVDINIDFNTCASIVRQGNGEFRMKPTLTAGQVSAISTGIGGRVVSAANGLPISGTVLVSVQQPDSAGFNRIVMVQSADALSGNFNFCPLPSGMYDIVAAAEDSTGRAYGATALLNVPAGTSVGQIPLTPTAPDPGAPAEIEGVVTSKNGAGFAVDVALAAFQPVTVNSTMRRLNVPLFNGSTLAVPTEATPSGVVCPADTFCAAYSLLLPAGNPVAAIFSGGGVTFPSPAGGAVLYQVEASAFRPMSGGTPTCTPSVRTTDRNQSDQPLEVTQGATVTAKRMDFTGCN
jgi:hypothetical protein